MKKISASIVFSLIVNLVFSQPISFDSDKNFSAESIIPFLVSNVVKGYYSVSHTRETDYKRNEWNVLVMDINFKIIHDFYFETDGRYIIKRSLFNGSHFFFTFMNFRTPSLQHFIYDMEGNRTLNYDMKDLKIAKFYTEFHDLAYSVPYKGYLRNGLNPEDEDYLEMIGNDGKIKWNIYPK